MTPPVCFLQALAILVQLEGVKFGRRVGSVLPLVAASLHKGLRSMDQQQQQTGADEEDEAAVAGWQEVYACLLLLERLATVLPTQVCCPTRPLLCNYTLSSHTKLCGGGVALCHILLYYAKLVVKGCYLQVLAYEEEG